MKGFATAFSVRRFWVTAGVSAAAVVAAAAVAILLLGAVGRSATALATARRDLTMLEARRVEISAAAAAFEQLGAERAAIAASFASPSDPLPFIERVENLGRRFGLKVELALAPGAGGAEGRDYAMRTAGSFRSVTSFFRSLESFPFLIEIGDAEFRRAEAVAPSGRAGRAEPGVELDVSIRTVAP